MSKALKRPRTIEERLQLLDLPPERDSCVFYKSFLEQLEELQGEEQAALAMAIARYALRRIKPTFEKGYLRAIWSGIEPQLDANWNKYLNALEKEQTYSKPIANNEQADSKAGGNVNENVNENENENVNVPQVAAEISEFELGLFLLGEGYLINAERLHEIYGRAKPAQNPRAYAVKAYQTKTSAVPDKKRGECCAQFITATGCRHTGALEINNITIEDGELCVNCTQKALDAISAKRMVEVAKRYNVSALKVYCIGHEPYVYDVL